MCIRDSFSYVMKNGCPHEDQRIFAPVFYFCRFIYNEQGMIPYISFGMVYGLSLIHIYNLITASSTGALLWARQIIAYLGVFQADTLEAWYEYFNTGKPEYFFALMQTLPSGTESWYIFCHRQITAGLHMPGKTDIYEKRHGINCHISFLKTYFFCSFENCL